MTGSSPYRSATPDAPHPGGRGRPTRPGAGTDHRITRPREEMRDGNDNALDRLLPLVYEELRRIARRQLRGQPMGHTLNTTALVHEAFLKLSGGTGLAWADRAHFFRVAARAMRQILINHAHRHATAKRGGRWRRIPLEDAGLAVEEQAEMLLALDEALCRLAALNERLSRVVECRFFGGMTEEEVAMALGVSDRTVRRDWLKARLWLYAELVEDETA
jgi:RNA polymerase sigma factor (TIGR02999 family)